MSQPVGPPEQQQPGRESPPAAATQAIAAPAAPQAAPPSGGNRPLVLVLVALLGLAVIAAGVLFFTGAFSSKPAASSVVTPVPVAPVPASATPVAVAPGAAVRAEPVGYLGPAPFTSPVGVDVTNIPAANPPIGTLVSGGLPGLYGYTGEFSCDKAKLVTFLQADPRKPVAFGAVLNVAAGDVSIYVGGLAEAVLRSDTAVITHDFANGAAVPVPAVFQAGTRVLVDDRGVPVVKCQSGSPLVSSGPSTSTNITGQRWPTLNPGAVTVIQPAPQSMTNIQLTNIYSGAVYAVPVSGAAALAKPTGPTATVDQGAKKVGCGFQARQPAAQPGTFQILNNSTQAINVMQYGPAGAYASAPLLPGSISGPFDTQYGDFFLVNDGQGRCLDGVFGPGTAKVS